MGDWLGSTIGAAGGLVGGVVSSGLNYAFNSKLADKDRKENYKYNEKAADNADKRARAMYWDLYSPEAQKQQYEDAGFSPSLMMGGAGGAGGATPHGAQGSGAMGIQTGYAPIDPMTAAQTALIGAQVEKTKAETDNLKEEKGLISAQITNTYADAGLKQAQTNLAKANEEYQLLVNYIKDGTAEYEIETIKQGAQTSINLQYKTYYEWQKEKQNFEFDKETFDKRIEEVNNSVTLLAEQIVSERQERQLTAAQTTNFMQATEKMAYEMQLAYANYILDAKQLNLNIQKVKSDYLIELKKYGLAKALGILNSAQGWANTVLDGLLKFTQAGYFAAANNSMIKKK